MAERIDPRPTSTPVRFTARRWTPAVSPRSMPTSAVQRGAGDQRPVLRALVNPELPADAKKRIITRMMDSAEPIARNGLLLLVDNRRVELLHDLQVAYAALAAVDEKILDIEVTTAVAFDDAERSEIERRISAAVGQTARVTAIGRPRDHRRAGTAHPRRPLGCIHSAPSAGAAAHPCTYPPSSWE